MTKQLALDDDVAAALAEEAERRRVPADQLANEELRRQFCSEQSKSRTPFVVKPFDSGFQPGIDPMKLKEYLYEEDDERILGLGKRSLE